MESLEDQRARLGKQRCCRSWGCRPSHRQHLLGPDGLEVTGVKQGLEAGQPHCDHVLVLWRQVGAEDRVVLTVNHALKDLS